jgi:hypothetical protein
MAHPDPLTQTYCTDYDSLRLSIDRYLRTLAYFQPKIVIRKHKLTGAWVLVVYKRPEWEAWKSFKKGVYRDVVFAAAGSVPPHRTPL